VKRQLRRAEEKQQVAMSTSKNEQSTKLITVAASDLLAKP
jgi:hypothetical protein